jgi:ankyrin repeat protein
MAIIMSLEYEGYSYTEFFKDDYTKRQLLEAFPDDAKISDSRGWLPLHFAILASSG